MRIFCVLSAYILDLIFGDPPSLPHPVKGIGWLINKLEAPFRSMIKDERLSGTIFASVIIILTWSITFTIAKAAYSFNNYLGTAVSIVIIYTSLSIKDLGVESLAVFNALKEGDIDRARTSLSKIVGRDTAGLDEREIIRAAVETVAENIVDGIISPLFYAFLGGAPLALAYKAVNTLDSMVGYKNDKYKNFGWASAKIDTLANFIPARLSILFLPLASLVIGKDALNSWRIAGRDWRKNPSLNSGIPEAAIAGALGVRLGGLNYYNSKPILKPFIGDDINALEIGHIKDSIKISYISSVFFLIVGAVLMVCIGKG